MPTRIGPKHTVEDYIRFIRRCPPGLGGEFLLRLRAAGELNYPILASAWLNFDRAIANGRSYEEAFEAFKNKVFDIGLSLWPKLLPEERDRWDRRSWFTWCDQRIFAVVLRRLYREEMARAAAPAKPSPVARGDADAAIWNRLTDRQRDCLQALAEAGAFSVDSRLRADEIAAKAEGRGANVNGFKQPLSELVLRGLAESKTGREGGYWLTGDGRRLMEHNNTASSDRDCA